MAVFKGATLTCKSCGDSFRVPPSRAASATTCSKECADKVRGASIERKVQIVCKGCGRNFRVPRCHEGRRVFCSHACREAHPDTIARKADRVGEQNPRWLGGIVKRADGYLYESAYHHPFTQNGYVLEHRLVMERHLRETDPASPYLTTIDGDLYLSPDYHVHHKDETRDNNAISNLQCMTPEEHRAHHREVMRKALAFYRLHFPAGVTLP